MNKIMNNQLAYFDNNVEVYWHGDLKVQANYISDEGWALVITEEFYNAMLGK